MSFNLIMSCSCEHFSEQFKNHNVLDNNVNRFAQEMSKTHISNRKHPITVEAFKVYNLVCLTWLQLFSVVWVWRNNAMIADLNLFSLGIVSFSTFKELIALILLYLFGFLVFFRFDVLRRSWREKDTHDEHLYVYYEQTCSVQFVMIYLWVFFVDSQRYPVLPDNIGSLLPPFPSMLTPHTILSRFPCHPFPQIHLLPSGVAPPFCSGQEKMDFRYYFVSNFTVILWRIILMRKYES